ncbi:MAG: aminotransferase class III-fold pyridoxal phosphate-dependent enzyme, partial [Rhodospirillaceae bacterium]
IGNAVLDVVLAKGFLENVSAVAKHFRAGLEKLVAKRSDVFNDVRGLGLMLGIKCKGEGQNGEVVKAAMARGLLTVPAGDNVVRLVPPLVISPKDADEAIAILDAAAGDVAGKAG